MAKGRGSTTDPATGWTCWSPSRTINRTKIDRRYVQVPSDQQKLLDLPKAWFAGNVSNVPPGVLEEVKARHAAESGLRSRVEREALSSNPSTPARMGREEFSSQPATPVQSERNAFSSQPASPVQQDAVQEIQKEMSAGAEGDGNTEEEVPGTGMSWTPSPSAHFRSPPLAKKLVAVASASSRHSPEDLDTRPAAQPILRAALLADFPPSSSLGSDPGLEYEVPKAITDVIEPANREAVAVLEPTPPSAQVIPSTIAEPTAPEQAHQTKKRRLMKHPALMFASPDRVNQRQVTRLAPPKTMAPRLPRLSSPVVESSSPVSEAPLQTAAGISPAIPSMEGGQRLAIQPDMVPATSQLVSNELPGNMADELPSNAPPSQIPFTVFKAAYPDYEGNLGVFIRGVMVLLKLQRDKSLPEFLYDDFLRVFSGDYLEYIGTVDPSQPAIPTIKWYCENVSAPLYTKGILNKSNVESITNQYADRVRAIQQALETSETVTHTPAARQAPCATGAHKDMVQQTRATTPQTNIAGHSSLTSAAALSPEPAADVESSSDAIHTTERAQQAEEPRRTAARPRSNIGVARSGTAHRPSMANDIESSLGPLQSQVDLSFPEIERTQTPQVARINRPIASTLPNGMLSQLSNPESIPETAIRRRLAPRSSNGSSAGQPGSAFKRPKRVNESPEARAVRWKQFLIHRATQSSAPGSSSAA